MRKKNYSAVCEDIMEASNAAKQITLLFGMIPPPKKKKAAEIIKVISPRCE